MRGGERGEREAGKVESGLSRHGGRTGWIERDDSGVRQRKRERNATRNGKEMKQRYTQVTASRLALTWSNQPRPDETRPAQAQASPGPGQAPRYRLASLPLSQFGEPRPYLNEARHNCRRPCQTLPKH